MVWIVFILCLVLTSPASAFINIESLRQTLEDGFNGSSGVSLSGASGNVDVSALGLNTQNIFRDEQREYIFMGDYTYGEAQGVKNNNRGSTHVRYAQGFAPWWFWETFAQAEFNEFQALTLRTVLGGGLRWALRRKERGGVFLGLGTFYEDEDIDGDADQANFRGNFYLSYRQLIGEQFETVLVAYYQPSYKTMSDYRLRLTAGFESKITESLQLVNNISCSYDSRPPAMIEREDFTYSVVFNFSY